MPDQQVERPTEAEIEWIRSHLAIARTLAAMYTGDEEAPLPNPSLLDEIFADWLAGWHEQTPAERDDPNVYINAVGLAFGQTLIDDLGLEWAVVSDEYGTEIAVHGQPGDVLLFPPNLVGKRFESGETGFLAPLYNEVAERVHALRRGDADIANPS